MPEEKPTMDFAVKLAYFLFFLAAMLGVAIVGMFLWGFVEVVLWLTSK